MIKNRIKNVRIPLKKGKKEEKIKKEKIVIIIQKQILLKEVQTKKKTIINYSRLRNKIMKKETNRWSAAVLSQKIIVLALKVENVLI